MKNLFLLCLFTISISSFFAQDEAGALKLIDEGIQLHDKGNYEAAVKKYDAALSLDKDNFYALAEKANSLNSQAKFEESIVVSRKCIEIHPDEKELNLVYVAYGNALDGLHKSVESVELYEEGISKFPEFYLLHFNKGITLISLKEYDQALLCFEQAAKYNPTHAGSQNAIGRFQEMKKKNIPAIMAYCRFFVIEPTGTRATENLASLESLLIGNATKTGKNSYSINFDITDIPDTTADGKPGPNTFTTTDLIVSLGSALGLEKKDKKKNKAQILQSKMELMISSLEEESAKGNSGFYWEFYVPYFIAMKNEAKLETFTYIAYASSGDKKVLEWINSHSTEIEKFYDWEKEYNW